MAGPAQPDADAVSGEPSQDTLVRGDLLYQAIAEGFADPQLAHVRAEALTGVLREVPIFSRLDEEELRRVAERAKVARVSARQVIVREGMSSEALYVLLTGSAAVSAGAAEQGSVGRGSCFGELGILDGAPGPVTVTATRDLWLVRLSASDFQALLDDEPRIARSLLASLSDRLRRLQAAGGADS
jgi:CRP-like cAMP-binding protein